MPPKEELNRLEELERAKKPPDFAELQKQKEELFRKIESDSLKLDIHDKQAISSLVLGFSMKDGFELAKRLEMRDDMVLSLRDPSVVEKNPKFLYSFCDFIGKNKQFVGSEHRGDIELLEKYVFPEKRESYETLPESYEFNHGGSRSYAAEIEKYYSNFIRNRRFESPDLPRDDRTQVEKTAEDHLASVEAVLKESYYTGPIREFLGIETEEKLEKSESYTNIEKNYFRPDFIDRNALNSLHNQSFPDKFQDAEVKKLLRKSRYAPSSPVFETRKKEAEKGLVKQIKDSLIKRGYKEDEFEVKFDEEKGEWVVNDKRDKMEGKEEEGKENLREVRSVSRDFIMKKSDPYYGVLKDHVEEESIDKKTGNITLFRDVRSIGGNVYEVIATGNTDSIYVTGFVIYPDGRRSSIHRGTDIIAETTNGLLIQGWNNNKNLQIRMKYFLDDKQIIEDNDWHSDSGIGGFLEKDKSIYSLANMMKNRVNVEALFKDDVIVQVFKDNESLSELLEVAGKISYIIEKRGDRRTKTLVVGDETFGPYDEIKLCENSKDKLIFYAKEGDKHFVYVDGKENTLFVKEIGEIQDITYSSAYGQKEKTVNIYFTEVGHENSSVITNESYLCDTYSGACSCFSDICGQLFYLNNVGNRVRAYWGVRHHEIDINMKDFTECEAVGFHDNVFISDGRRVLSHEYADRSFKFNEIKFDGEVEVVNSGGKLFIIESLDDKKRIWEWSEKLELQEREQKDLDLANAVAKEDLPAIDGYFDKYYPEEEKKSTTERVKSGLKGALEQSKRFVGTVNQTIKEAPELFLDTLRAKNDKPTEFLMTQMFYYMFPEAQAKREKAMKEAKENRRNPWNIFGGGGEGGGGGRGGKGETIDYNSGTDHLASVDEAGYYEMLKANREVLRLREPLPPSTFITQGLFGNYTGSGWTKVNVPISQEVHDPAKETTFEFVDENASQNINLPKIAGSKIIKERLKGITAKGQEVPVKILEENNLGEVRVDKGKEAKRITYSLNYSEMPKTMTEVTADDYDKFRKGFERSFGEVMTKPIGDIGDELDIFIVGLRDKSPREQVIAIQEFCYEYGYYNIDNKPRDTDNFEERLAIMEGRMDDLKSAKPELSCKKYAGICTDFATLTTALLRKAGFVSGIASGYATEAGSTVVKTNRAHAVSYVLWPNPENKDGKPDMIVVDGTPSSITPRIVEQEKKAAEMIGELSVDAEKELAELEKVLKTMDPESIKKLQNGQLEKTLNHILYGVKQSHVDVMNRVLNASRYAGFDILEMARGNIEDQIEFRKFLEEEIFSEKGKAHDNRGRRGEELFNMMLEFSRRFEKDKNVKGKEEALDVLEKIFDMSERYLDPIETRSAAATITYLRARKMK